MISVLVSEVSGLFQVKTAAACRHARLRTGKNNNMQLFDYTYM